MNTDQELTLIAKKIRQLSLTSIYQAQSGHPGGSLSIAEIMAVLYFDVMDIDPNDSKNVNRDRFILSKGHCAPAYYSTLALKGYFNVKELDFLRKGKDTLQGHPSMIKTNGVDYSTGSLGQGLSIANGMALVAKRRNMNYTVFCLCGDGELQEGQIWEAIMTSAHYHLNNLVLIVDSNGLQIDGKIKEVMNNDPISEKIKAFNWNVIEVDGHDIVALRNVLHSVYKKAEKPTCILAKTTKGKGVSFMENKVEWHGSAPNEEQYKQAILDLNGGNFHG